MPGARRNGRSREARAFSAHRVADAVMELATAGGYHAVQMREVARRASVSLDTLYRYYSSKDLVIQEAIIVELARLREDIEARPPRQASPAGRAGAVFIRAFHALVSNRGYAHAAMSSYHVPGPFDPHALPPQSSPLRDPHGLNRIAAFAAWGSGYQPTEEERTALFVLESLFASSAVSWLNGHTSADVVVQQLMFAAEQLLDTVPSPSEQATTVSVSDDDSRALIKRLLTSMSPRHRRALAEGLLGLAATGTSPAHPLPTPPPESVPGQSPTS